MCIDQVGLETDPVNTTDSAVRVTHLPTGLSVANQDQKSQHKNKDKAIKILTNKIFDILVEKERKKERC